MARTMIGDDKHTIDNAHAYTPFTADLQDCIAILPPSWTRSCTSPVSLTSFHDQQNMWTDIFIALGSTTTVKFITTPYRPH